MIILPYPKDDHFVDRPVIFDEITDLLGSMTGGPRAALVGIGGVGKSQIAIEYAHRLKVASPQTHIFWVMASNPARFRASYVDIAIALQLPGFDDPKTDLLGAAFQWLNREANGKCLIILDNMDDAAFATYSHNRDSNSQYEFTVRQYLPYRAGCAILITSRNSKAASDLIGDSKRLVEVPTMTRDEAKAILDKKIDAGLGTDKEKMDLASILDYVPLALTQAAAHISRRRYMSIARYIINLRNRDEQRQSALLREEADLRRDEEASNAVFRTWHLSFDHISEESPLAANILSQMSLFDRKSIPEFLLRAVVLKTELEEALQVLEDYAFITAEVDETTFAMHRLVQLATTAWLRSKERLEHQVEAALEMLAKAYPFGKYENWAHCRILEPHVQSILKHNGFSDKMKLFRASFQHCRGWYHERLGNFVLAREITQQSVLDRQTILGPEHSLTLISMTNLGAVYYSLGEYQKAEGIDSQTLELQIRVLGEEDFDTLVTMGNLALVRVGLGHYREAEMLNKRELDLRVKVLGAEHVETLGSMANLADISCRQGRYDEAEHLHSNVLELQTKALGTNNPLTLQSKCGLAITYFKQGRWDEAENVNLEVLEVRSKIFGVEHPETLVVMMELANTYAMQNRLDEALNLQLKTLDLWKKVLGVEHPGTLSSMANLACDFKQQKRWKEAEKLESQALEARSRVLGAEHPDTLESMANLAYTYYNINQWKEAEELDSQVLDIRRRVLGEEHPDTLQSWHDGSFTFWFTRDQDDKCDEKRRKAIRMVKTAAELRCKVLGEDHPDTIESQKFLEEWQAALLTEREHVEVSPTHSEELSCNGNYTDRPETKGRKLNPVPILLQLARSRGSLPRHGNSLSSQPSEIDE